ncbi:MAG TPA: hypothetical protein VJV78_10780, partial [Polyangiales bacterium]|nr:hypothetical protein [Polyangiales bacterium]
GDERVSLAARRALVAHGQAGFEAARAALGDVSLRMSLRWQLPRTLAQFAPQPAADALLARLTEEGDGMTRYRIIRALETLVAREPALELARPTLQRVIGETLARAYRLLDARMSLTQGAAEEPARNTPGHELLVHVLRHKEQNACGRLLRVLGLAHPAADFARIRRGLRNGSEKTRANSIELVASALEQPLRSAVLGLIDELSDEQRLSSAGSYYRPQHLDYEAQLERMLTRESAALQDFTAFHVGELGLSRFAPLLVTMVEREPGRADLVRALGRLQVPPQVGTELAPC